MGVAKNTYLRAEKGDPKVGLGVYAMALFVLGFGSPLALLSTYAATILASCSMKSVFPNVCA